MEYLNARGISPFAWIMTLDASLAIALFAVRALVDNFLEETERELFDTEEEARKFYAEPANFSRLRDGEIGSNLLFGSLVGLTKMMTRLYVSDFRAGVDPVTDRARTENAPQPSSH